ncbi:CHC2 zinc finger domain-containing protein [Ferruginivarius sediminum]|uniref:CHC2 zinc finger domain-containing protein n=1 Tax=Ferruginivarius sediminum TaxID=2661937 RepID=UPI001F4EE72D|nr:CHC2 zinc finger domain-containing protein [Ferruginivarius sediminum]
MTGAGRIGGELVERANGVDLAGLVGGVVKLRRHGRRYWGLCPFHAEKTPSFSVMPDKGFYYCFGCGAGGDAIAFVRAIEGLSFSEAVERLTGERGGEKAIRRRPPPSPEEREAREARELANRTERAMAIWRGSQPADGTLVEAYLRARGIELSLVDWPIPSLRYHPEAEYWHAPKAARRARLLAKTPAMVAGIQDARGRVVGAHVTHLQPDGNGKALIDNPDFDADNPESGPRYLPAKKMHGTAFGGAVRLAPPSRSGLWMVAEGIETALSVLMCERADGRESCVWAALSLGNLAGGGLGQGARHPNPKRPGQRLPSAKPDMHRPGVQPPDWAREARVLADGDGKDPPSQRCLEARAQERFRRLVGRASTARPPAGMDFNDLVRGEKG